MTQAERAKHIAEVRQRFGRSDGKVFVLGWGETYSIVGTLLEEIDELNAHATRTKHVQG
jgi:hypothetical protein